jgi:hypothetical protein
MTWWEQAREAYIVSTGTRCCVNVSWNGEYDADGDPNGPAQWPVFCGQPVAGEVGSRRWCQKHLETDRPFANIPVCDGADCSICGITL